MKRMMTVGIFASLALILAVSIAFAKDPAKATKEALNTFVQGCEKELTTYCKEVTPGQGRIVACLYAHQDKLSPRCEYALYDSAAQLDRALNDLTYAVNECRGDLESHCADIRPGEGRLIDCLNNKKEKVSDRCRAALKEVGYNK